jgi:hypothetical protein
VVCLQDAVAGQNVESTDRLTRGVLCTGHRVDPVAFGASRSTNAKPSLNLYKYPPNNLAGPQSVRIFDTPNTIPYPPPTTTSTSESRGADNDNAHDGTPQFHYPYPIKVPSRETARGWLGGRHDP